MHRGGPAWQEEQARRSFLPEFVLHSCLSSTDALCLSSRGEGRTRRRKEEEKHVSQTHGSGVDRPRPGDLYGVLSRYARTRGAREREYLQFGFVSDRQCV